MILKYREGGRTVGSGTVATISVVWKYIKGKRLISG